VVDELAPLPDDIRVDKYRMSGFWDTPLDSILRNLGVSTLLFAGVNVDQCVLCTLQDANFLGYDCLLVEDCAATTSPPFCTEATMYNVRQCFGFTLHSTDLAKALRT
jgi:ureidoacrylate peracid hydrolase